MIHGSCHNDPSSLSLQLETSGLSTRPNSMMLLDRNGDFLPRGLFLYALKEHMEIMCNMDFGNYPMDSQTCNFRFTSGLYDKEKLASL